MADKLRGGTTIGGHLAFHKGNLLKADIDALAVIAANMSGVLAIANGGTNMTTYAKGDLLYARDTNVLTQLPISGTDNKVLKLVSGLPAWVDSSSLVEVTAWNSTTGELTLA